MVTGTVNAALDGNIRLPVVDAAGSLQVVEATVDSGFTEFLTLPRNQIQALGLRYLYYDVLLLADGTTVLFNIYEATVVWDGVARVVPVLESEVFPLVGRRMMAGYHLHMEMVVGGMVKIEKLP